jgi:hypothetical protein
MNKSVSIILTFLAHRQLREQLNDQQQKFDYQRWFEREKLKVLSNRHMSLQIKQAIHKRDYEALYV